MSTNHNDGVATPYAAIYLLFEDAGKVPLLLRSNTGWMDGYYGLPSGRVERGETMTKAAIREAEEEVGVILDPKYLEHAATTHIKADDETEWLAVGFRVIKWEGKLYNAEPHVHGELKWFDVDHLPNNVVPAHLNVLEAMLKAKTYTEHGW